MGSVSIGRMSRDDSPTKAGIFDTILNCKVNLFMMFATLTSYCLCRYIYLSQDGINNIKSQRSNSFAPASPYQASTGSGKTSFFSSVQLFSFVVDCLALILNSCPQDLGIKSDQVVKLIDSSYFDSMIAAALKEPRKRKMVDLTKNPTGNTMQVAISIRYSSIKCWRISYPQSIQRDLF